jgi:hypothetical protein
MQRRAKKKNIPDNIFLLHDTAGRQILSVHDAAGSQFGSREPNQKTLETI